MTKMLAFDPTDRLSIAQIRQHEWFTEPIASKVEIIEEFTKRKESIDCNKPTSNK